MKVTSSCCSWSGILTVSLQLLDGRGARLSGVTSWWGGGDFIGIRSLHCSWRLAVAWWRVAWVCHVHKRNTRHVTDLEILSWISSTFVIFLHFVFVLFSFSNNITFFLAPFVSCSLFGVFLFPLCYFSVYLTLLFLNLAFSFLSISCFSSVPFASLFFSVCLIFLTAGDRKHFQNAPLSECTT
jgi:hypothetical protein